MTGRPCGGRPTLDVRPGVITAMARSAAEGVPGVAHPRRGGPRWLRLWGVSPVAAWLQDDRVHLWIVAEGAVALPDLAQRVRSAVAGAVERQLDLVLADVSVVVDGVRG